MAGATIRAQIKLDGGRAFADDFDKSAASIRSANQQIKFFTNEIDRNGSSQDRLRSKLSALQSAYDSEGQAVEKLKNRIEEVKNQEGDNEKAIDNLTQELYKHMDAQSQLQSEMDATKDSLDNFESKTDEAADGVDELGDEATETGGQISKNLAKDIAIGTTFMSELVNIAKELGQALWNVGKDAVAYNSQMESYSKTIQAFFKTSGQGADEAAKNTEDLIAHQKELSRQVGMGTDVLIEANKMLIAAGTSGEDSQVAVEALAKAIVATGGGNQELQRMASNMQQIANTGKASSMDLKQFAMAGVDVYGLMADTTGKTVEELHEMDITFDMIVEALQAATSEGGKFFEASQVGATTLDGQMNTLQSTIQDKLGGAFEPVNKALAETLVPAAQDLVEHINWDRFASDLETAFEGIAHAIGLFIDGVTWVMEKNEALRDAYDDVSEGLTMQERAHNALARAILSDAGLIDQGSTVVTRACEDAAGAMLDYINEAAASSRGMQNLASESFTWGEDMMNGFADGIGSGVPAVQSAAATAAGAVRELMHFSRPDAGPLRDYEAWMPDMMQGFAKGIEDNIWRVQSAASTAAGAIAGTMAPVTSIGSINMTVNGAQGQSAQEIADVVMLKIQQATNRRSAVWG